MPPVSRTRRENPAARKGKWSPRGTGDDSPHLFLPTSSRVSVAVIGCARVTGKAGENGQNSEEMGGSSPWTRPSAPECGDTLKALASGRFSLDLRWGILFKKTGSGVAIDWVTCRSYSRSHKRAKGRRLNVQSGLREDHGSSSVAVRDRGH